MTTSTCGTTATASSTEAFFDTVADYREAVRVLDGTRPGSQLHEHVTAIVVALGPRTYDLTLRCMLCNGSIPHETTVAEYAELHGPPRGICGRH